MGTLTITTTAPQDARLVAAFGRLLNLGRNATAAEVKQNVKDYIRQVVIAQERADAYGALAPITFDPS